MYIVGYLRKSKHTYQQKQNNYIYGTVSVNQTSKHFFPKETDKKASEDGETIRDNVGEVEQAYRLNVS